MNRYTVSAPATPGAMPSDTPARTLRDARQIARSLHNRRDLRYCDVRILRHSKLVEYAGPLR